MSQTQLILLFAVGLAAVFAEILIPGMIVGICGAICMIASIYWAYQIGASGTGNIMVAVSIISVPIFILLWYRLASRTFAVTASEAGFNPPGEFEKLMGQDGVTLTGLHPTGIANIQGRRVDVVTRGEMVPKGARVKVIEVRGNRVIVKSI
ncbi:MAG: NfeD family protein [Candidatus Brocadiales bacterium]